jgi:hypothetical protein
MEILGALLNYEVLIGAMTIVVWASLIYFIIMMVKKLILIRETERDIRIAELKASLWC